LTEESAPTSEEFDACYRAVEALCAERGLASTRQPSPRASHLGVQLQGARRSWDLEVDCSSEALTRLPRVGLRGPTERRAHVGYYGTVCISDNQGLSLDPDRRPDLVAFAVAEAYDLLEKWDADAPANEVEFYNELEGYWLGLPGSVRARAAMEVDGKDRLVSVYHDAKGQPTRWYFAEQDTKPALRFELKNLAPHRALYVHLEHPVAPPVYPDTVDAAFLDAVRDACSPAQKAWWDKLLGPSKNSPKRLALLLSVPRAAGGLSVIGVAFGARDGKVDPKVAVTPLTVRRHTSTYMRERGGASADLFGKHVAVLGCGAVGGVVADLLASVGVGRLTLVDGDSYSEDNVFRHILDPLWVDSSKVSALKYELERHYPGLKVTAYPGWAQEWLKSASFDDVDAVVIAFGLPTLERSFNRAFRSGKKRLPLLFTWLEPLDLGGHSVLVWSEGEGCLGCLYRDDEGAPALQSRTAFLEPDQAVSKNLTGCSSVFVPFGALQARRTALQAVEHLLTAMAGGAGASYRFWVGEGKAAAAQGLRTTPWWSQAPSVPFAEATRRVFGLSCRRCRSAA
jgi:ThiF family